MRIIKRVILFTFLSLFLLIILVVLVALFPPIGLFRDTIANKAGETLGVEVRIGDIDISTLSHIVLKDIYVGPPQGGYTRPVFEMKELALRYSVIGAAFSNEVVVEEILIDSPHAALETINGKTSIDAMLANLPPSEPKPEEPEEVEEPETPGEPSPFKITLKKLTIRDVRAFADIGTHVVDFHSLGVDISGFFSQLESHFDVAVNIAGEPGKPNIHFEQRGAGELPGQTQGGAEEEQLPATDKGEEATAATAENTADKPETSAIPNPVPVKADIELALKIDVAADHVLEPKADVKLDFMLKSHSIDTIWKLEPLQLNLNVEAVADMKEDSAEVKRISFSFNREEMINLRAALKGLIEQKNIDVFIERIRLPLDAFSPYIRPFVPDTEVGGEIAVEKLAVKGEVPKLLAQGLPELQGEINIRELWADYGPMDAHVKGINAHLELATIPIETATPEKPAMAVNGFVKIGSAVYPGAKVENLNLDLSASADDMQPADAKVALMLNIPTINYSNPSLGSIALNFATDLSAEANLRDGEFKVDHISVNVADTIKLKVSAEASVDQATSEVRSYRTEVNLENINFEKALKLVPAGIRKNIPQMKLSGSLGAVIRSDGAIPTNFGDPLKLPVNIDTTFKLNGVNLDYPDQQLKLDDLKGELSIKGKPSDLVISGDITAAKAVKADQTATLEGLKIPIKIRFRPAETNLELGASIAALAKTDQALKAEDIGFSTSAKITGDIPKQKFNLLSGTIKLGMGKAQYMKGMTAKLEGQYMQVDFSYDQRVQKGSVGYKIGMKQAEYQELQALLKDFEFRIGAQIVGVDIPIIPNPDQHPELAEATIEMDLAELWKTDIFPDEPLRNTTLRTKAVLHDMRDADLEKVEFLVPSLGVRYTMSGKAWNVLDDSEGIENLKFADFDQKYPEFDVELFAGIDLPQKQKLIGELSASGMVGLKSRARSLPNYKAVYEGSIVAKDFNLWNVGHGEKLYPDGHTEPTETHIHLADMNSSVPMIQYIDLKEKTISGSKGNIFEEQGRGALYETMRLYSDIRSNFTIDRIDVKILEGDKKGKNLTEKNLSVDQITLDMIYNDNTFAIDRLYIALLGGDITGKLQAQLARLQPSPDVRLHFENQITGVNLAYLADSKTTDAKEDTEISAMINLDVGVAERHIEGDINLTKLSLKQLDKLLVFLDPDEKDTNIQRNRNLINAWYVKGVDPKVNLVSIWIKYGNLNMDIALDAWFFIGDILQNVVEKMKIRRQDVMKFANPIFDKISPREKGTQENQLSAEEKEFPAEETASTSDSDTL